VAERDELPACEKCGGILKRIISATMLRLEIPAYVSPSTGEYIDSRQKRREDLKRSGAIEWEPGIREDIKRQRAALNEASFKELDNTVDDIVRDKVVTGELEA
jgi:hypothetical protein